MEILQTTAKMQQAQMGTSKAAEAPTVQSVQPLEKAQINQESVTEAKTTKVTSKEEIDALITELNRALDPFNTSVRFGFDNSSEDFYVSVIDTQHNEILRRFPLKQAEQLLPKMRELTGILFDQKG